MGDTYAGLNKTMTIKAKVYDGSSYSETATKGAINATSYSFTNYTTCNTSESASLAKGGTSTTMTVGYTALTKLAVSNVEDGYVFMGWFDASGNELSVAENFNDYHPAATSNFTVYAYFAPVFTESTLYLNRKSNWGSADHYAAYFFAGGNNTWVSCSLVEGESSIYSVGVPDGDWACVVFCKMNGATNNWSNVAYQTSNMMLSGVHNCVSINADDSYNQTWSDYAPIPAISGQMNNWSPTANQFSGTPLRVKIHLAAGKAYQFKVAKGADGWYGHGDHNNDLVFVGQTNAEKLASGKNNIMLLTAEEGDYIFEWDATSKDLTVSYPSTSYHSTNYMYVSKDGSSTGGWNSGDYCYGHFWGAGGSLTTHNVDYLKLTATTEICGANYYYFPALSDYPSFKVREHFGDGGYESDAMSSTDNGGKFVRYSSSWGYGTFTFYTLSFAAGTDGTGSMSSVGHICPGADQTIPSCTFERAGYNFSHWTANVDVTIDDATVTAGSDISDGATLESIGSNVTLTAQWTPKTLYFAANSGNNWNTDENWTDDFKPTINHPVRITAPVTVNTNAAKAQSVVLDQSSSTNVILTINADAALEVNGTIKVYNGTSNVDTDADDIYINADADGQGALILNNSSGNTRATVEMYSKASNPTFQFVAIPVSYVSINPTFAGEGVYTYVWHEGTGWERRNYYEDLSAFEAVGLTRASAHDYTFSGNLASTADRGSVSLTYTTSSKYPGMNMFGNSWTAPISIAALDEKITGNAESTVYVYEDGDWATYETAGAGDDDVIPAMQAYTILATSGGGSLELNYSAVRAVLPSYRTEALRAPKHKAEGFVRMNLYVSGNERRTKLRLYEGEQFTNEFDNGWEGRYLEGDGRSGQLYAQTDDKMTVMASPNLEGTVVGFIPGEAENYTISFNGDEAGYYLNDVKLGKSTLITEGNTYEFRSDESTNATRFIISKTPMSPTGIEDVVDGTNARKQLIDGALYIIRDGRIYTATGNVVK